MVYPNRRSIMVVDVSGSDCVIVIVISQNCLSCKSNKAHLYGLGLCNISLVNLSFSRQASSVFKWHP